MKPSRLNDFLSAEMIGRARSVPIGRRRNSGHLGPGDHPGAQGCSHATPGSSGVRQPRQAKKEALSMRWASSGGRSGGRPPPFLSLQPFVCPLVHCASRPLPRPLPSAHMEFPTELGRIRMVVVFPLVPGTIKGRAAHRLFLRHFFTTKRTVSALPECLPQPPRQLGRMWDGLGS